MNNLQIFNFKNKEVRTVVIDGEPFFVGKDVAEILGYKDTVNALKQHVDNEDKLMGSQNTTPYIIDSMGRKQYPTYINESGVYALIFGSKLPEAKEFKHKVTHEILPQIRQTGVYGVPQSFREALLLAAKQQEEIEIKNQVIGELKPKADYTDKILKSKSLVTITQIAKDYGMSGTEMNKLLHDLNVQYKQSGQWLLYREHQSKGYTHSETFDLEDVNKVVMTTKWTQKGRLFLYELLKVQGVLPLVEQESQ